MLTTGTSHGATILAELAARGIRPQAVLLERPAGRHLRARLADALRRRGAWETARAIARRLVARLRPAAAPWHSTDFYATFAERVLVVPSLSGTETLVELTAVRPDVIVLGGAPILPEAILRTARLGVLNAHPGLLPAYRGVDVVAHAVLDGSPVGATVHLVDTGIDTGGIVARVEVAPLRGEGLEALQRRVEAAAGACLADALDRLLRDGSLPVERQGDRHPLRRRLPPERRREADRRLRTRT